MSIISIWWRAAVAATIVAPWQAAAQVETPLGGAVTTLERRFNGEAGAAGFTTKIAVAPCDSTGIICPISFNGRKMGHLSRVEDRDEVETILIVHNCSSADAQIVAEASETVARIIGKNSASAKLEVIKLRQAIERRTPRFVLVTGGLEITTSGTSCTTLIARPLPTGKR